MLVRSASSGEWVVDEIPIPHRRGGGRGRIKRRVAWLRLLLGSAAAVFGLVQLARTELDDTRLDSELSSVRPTTLTAPPPGWEPIPHATPLFALQAPLLGGLPSFVEARRHASGGREDKFVFGVFESEASHLRLALFHGGPDPKARPAFYLDMARRAGEAGLSITRSALPSVVETKLGTVEIAPVVLADSVERQCLGFRLQRTGPELSGHGWYCTPPEMQPDRRELACLIDRLTLVPGPEGQSLRMLFAPTDRSKGESCEPRPPGRSKSS